MWRSRAWNSLPGFQLSQRKGVPGTPKGQYNQKHNGNSEVANASKSHLHVSHANICLDVLLKRCSVPHQLQLKIITLFLGQMKGLHQQPHGLVTSPAQKMQGFFPWNHVLLLFPSFIHSFGFATRLQTSTETNYPLALATCRTHFHLGKTKKQQVQLEGIIISDDKASSSISNSAVLSQHLRSGKYASRCLLRGHRWSLLIICFWTQLNIFLYKPQSERNYSRQSERNTKYIQELNNSRELLNFPSPSLYLQVNPGKSFPRLIQVPPLYSLVCLRKSLKPLLWY